jgi:RimJ/RimL family protein N-acetyltransferase
MRNYFLTSVRLGFSYWTAEDLPLALGLWGDSIVTKLTGGPFTPSQVNDRLAQEIQTLQLHGMQYWPIFLLKTGEHVGCCGLRPHDADNGVLELGFQLRQAYWNCGLGREAAQAAIAYGFNSLGARALYAGHHPANDASRRLLQSLGFRYTHNEFYPPTQEIEPCYSITREDYPLT